MNKNINISAFEFHQNNQIYITTVLPHDLINDHSEVLVYGNNPEGYQREPEPTHYNKIKDYILKSNEFILPTSIVLAVDEEDISKIFYENKLNFNLLGAKEKIFRIVDGQHRIIAMKEAIKSKPVLKNFLFNVIILITKKDKRSIEMEVFYDINSKSKRLKVDLIELARFNYRILEKTFKPREINEHISIQTAYYLNEKIEDCVWNNAIKFGIHDDHVIGVIGVNAFRESISNIVEAYLHINDNGIYNTLEGKELVKYSQISAYKIAEFIHQAWSKTIKNKWDYCFSEGNLQLDLFFEPKKVYYNARYYIQRTMGAKSINSILGELVNSSLKDGNKLGLNDKSLKAFDKLINESQLISDDWQVGGTFSGYSSESGFKKVSQFIKNDYEVTRKF